MIKVKEFFKCLFCKHEHPFEIWRGYVMWKLLNASVGICPECGKVVIEWIEWEEDNEAK
jgi:hypothetical protein